MNPTPVSDEDRRWLKDLHERIWVVTTDRFNHKHGFPKDNKALHHRVFHKVKRLLREHELPCVLHSGPYGGLWMGVYNHSDVPGVPPEFLASLDEVHLGLKGGFKEWDGRFAAMAEFTHSDRNKQMLAFYGLREAEDIDHYRY